MFAVVFCIPLNFFTRLYQTCGCCPEEDPDADAGWVDEPIPPELQMDGAANGAPAAVGAAGAPTIAPATAGTDSAAVNGTVAVPPANTSLSANFGLSASSDAETEVNPTWLQVLEAHHVAPISNTSQSKTEVDAASIILGQV